MTFYDEDDTFERIGLELILSPFESSYANEGPTGTSGMSFILKHKSVNAYIAPKHGGIYVRLLPHPLLPSIPAIRSCRPVIYTTRTSLALSRNLHL